MEDKGEATPEDWNLLKILRDVLVNAPCPLFAKDPSGAYILVNRAYRSLLEISSEHDAFGADDTQLHHPKIADAFRSFDESVIDEKRTRVGRFEWHASDEPGELERRTAPVLDSSDTIQALVGTLEPVYASASPDAGPGSHAYNLAERVKELRCLYEVSNLLLHIDAMSSETLNEVAECLPDGWQFPDLACARISIGEKRGQTSNFVETRWVQRRKFEVDGDTGTIEVGYTSRPDVDHKEVFLEEEEQLLQSIADRLREAWIRAKAERQAKLHTKLLDTVGEAVIATNVDGQVIYWNRAAEEIYGWTSDEAMGRSILELTPADAAAEQAEDILDSLSDGAGHSNEFLVKDKDSREFVAHVTDAPFYDDSGHLVGYVGVSRDVSEMKQLEAELSQAKKLEALGRLAGGIAHDFNNMLTAIQGNAMLLAEDVDDEEQSETVAEIQHAAERAEELTSQLLAFSRRQVRNPRVLNLGRVVEDMRKMLERLLDENIELDFSIADDAGSVKADASQLNQILMNLAVNARDAASGQDQIEVSVYNRTLSEPGGPKRAPAGDFVVLEVSDTGAGMSAETLENIFEPFFTTKSEEHGTGLGLATVFGIVKQSGGYIDVESEPGVGTSFRVYLPRVFDAPEALEDEQVRIGRSTSQTGTILVCEDQDSVRDVTRKTLERRGFEVVTASNGAEALQIILDADRGFDLVVSDVVMPGMSGWELEASVREHHPDLPFLFVSGYPDPASDESSHTRSPEHYLEKPFSPSALLDRVASLLR